MRPPNEYHDARRMLRTLLEHAGDGTVALPPTWTDKEREFLIVTCAHTIVLYHISMMAGFDAAAAMDGMAELNASLRKQIYAICDEEEEPVQ